LIEVSFLVYVSPSVDTSDHNVFIGIGGNGEESVTTEKLYIVGVKELSCPSLSLINLLTVKCVCCLDGHVQSIVY